MPVRATAFGGGMLLPGRVGRRINGSGCWAGDGVPRVVTGSGGARRGVLGTARGSTAQVLGPTPGHSALSRQRRFVIRGDRYPLARCSLLWPDPARRGRLVEIRDN